MLRLTVAGIAIISGLLALSATMPAMADTLSSATLTGDCKSLTITVTAVDLTPGITYQVGYSVVQTGGRADLQPAGTITFTAIATTQSVHQSGNWDPPLTTNVTLHDGTATLTSSGSTVQISPLTLSCGTRALPEWGIVARAIHVLGIVVWIGGLWLITIVLLPAMRQTPPEERIREFHAVEHRFAPQVWIAMLLVLLSGLYMLYRYDLWHRFANRDYWWMDFMIGVWVLFVLEQLVIRRILHKRATAPLQTTVIRMLLMRVLLVFSLFAIFAAIGGSHGLF